MCHYKAKEFKIADSSQSFPCSGKIQVNDAFIYHSHYKKKRTERKVKLSGNRYISQGVYTLIFVYNVLKACICELMKSTQRGLFGVIGTRVSRHSAPGKESK